MKKYWGPSLAVIIFLCLCGWWFWKTELHIRVSTKDAFIDGFKVSIGSDMPARIVKLYVDEGSYVKIGDLLADLDASILLAEKRAAQTKIDSLKLAIQFEEMVLEKMHNQKDFISVKTKLAATQAELDCAIAALHILESQLSHTQIFAPINGTIVKRHLWQGDVVYPGQAIFSLYDTKNIWITANIEETKIRRIKLHDPVEIIIDAYPQLPFQGRVLLIKKAAASEFSLMPQDNATGNYTKISQRIPIKVSIHDHPSAPYIFPGMSAKVVIHVSP
jgi:membrane fusion protein, multidrug efflux system